MSNYREMSLPLSKEDLATLKSGEEVHLTGTVYTLRDAGHRRCLEYLRENGSLPYSLEGQTIFYAGPTPATADQPFGAIGPTTSSRMDFATPEMMDAGIVATVGKGKRSKEVIDACTRNGGVYFAAVGGIAALLAQHVTESTIIAWEDLGTEALRKIEVKDFPVYVDIDVNGNCLYRSIEDEQR